MSWELKEALEYYGRQGAPGDQNMLKELFKEIQAERGGALLPSDISEAAGAYGIKESFILAVIKRVPGLRLSQSHSLQICAGPNCHKKSDLSGFVKERWGEKPRGFTVELCRCMHMCGRGPNIKWDGKIYNKADKELLIKLIEK